MNRSFKLLYEQILDSLITEGGNAIPDVKRIKREDIAKTVKAFKQQIIIPYLGKDPGDDMFLLGSTGKKKDSGDIDLGISLSAFSNNDIMFNLIKLVEACAKNGYNSCINTLNYDMLHVAFPQSGNHKLVQIDLLLTDSPEFTKFFMFSPNEGESKYKGAHRNTLLRAILLAISFKPTQFDKNNAPVKWEQLDLTETGLYKQSKTLIDLNGNKLLYKNTNEPLKFLYAKAERQMRISNDVDYIVKYVVGKDFSAKDITSFEKLLNIVQNDPRFRYSMIVNKILSRCAEFLDKERNKLEFPKELKKYL